MDKPIRPATVSARTHEITRLPNYRDEGFLRTGYDDIEDYAQIHITFSDGTVADIFSSELVMGGVYNWLEVYCNNHRTRCNLNPINAVETFNPREDILKDVYVVEKIEHQARVEPSCPGRGMAAWVSAGISGLHGERSTTIASLSPE